MHRRDRYTRDGTRRRRLDAAAPLDPRARFGPNAPKGPDDPETERDNAATGAATAGTAAAGGDPTAALAAAKAAARAAALARFGANSTGSATDAAAAAAAEHWAAMALDLSTGLSTITATEVRCRKRGATATLCGHSEYASPSTPPKKYRTQTASGGEYWCGRSGAGCTGSYTNQSKNVYAGTFVYNASTCATTNTQTKKFYGDGAAGSCTGAAPTLYSTDAMAANWAPGFVSVGPTLTTTPTTKTWDFTGICALGASFNGTAVSTLTDEDTEASAIARSSASWGSWTVIGDGTGGTCLTSDCCGAKIEQRTSGFTLTFQESQFQADFELPEGDLAIFKVGIYRRAYGSTGDFSLFATQIHLIEGNSSGEDTVAFDVPNAVGYETFAIALPSGS